MDFNAMGEVKELIVMGFDAMDEVKAIVMGFNFENWETPKLTCAPLLMKYSDELLNF